MKIFFLVIAMVVSLSAICQIDSSKIVINNKLIASSEEVYKDRMLFTQDILEKKFGLLQWIAALNTMMLTINSILLGFASFLIDKFDKRNLKIGKILTTIAIVFISGSLVFCLISSLPIIKSSLWKTNSANLIVRNPRTVPGIKEFSNKEYTEHLKTLTYEKMLEYNADEILKVNTNILDYNRKIRIAGFIAVIGLLILVFSIIISVYVKPTGMYK